METYFPLIVTASTIVLFSCGYAILAGLHRRSFFARLDSFRRALPDRNCGACGFAQCLDYASALASGSAGPLGCIPGGPSTAYALADLLGVSAEVGEPMMAAVHCKGGKKEVRDHAQYEGITDCHAALLINNSIKACFEGCLGLGSCVPECPVGALFIGDNGVAAVDRQKCTGCGKCIAACPRHLLSLIPHVHKIYLACANHDHGERVSAYCSVGCTGCEDCAKITSSGAISMPNHLPRLDYYTPNENFVAATYACPSKCFVDLIKARPKANIDTKCDGCGECILACPVSGAIGGQHGQRHVIKKEKCIGCGRCLNSCHVRAISLWGSLGYEIGIKSAQ